MMEEEDKSTEKSNAFRKIGNDSFQKSLYYDALKSYNKSLCYAKSSEDASLAYGNRSAVYFELKLYQHCLDNIELALPDYPQDKVAKLIERQEKCRKIILENVSLESIDPLPFYKEIKDMIKLSYPANPKIPYIAGCLEMKTDVVFGRGIYATRDLNPGDIIAIEDIRVNHIIDAIYERCCICMKANNLDLHSVGTKATLMVCSTECKEKKDMLRKFNESSDFYLEKIVMDLGLPEDSHYDAIKANKPQLKTIFDYDWSNLTGDEYKLAYLNCFYGLKSCQLVEVLSNQKIRFTSEIVNTLIASKIWVNSGNVRDDGETTLVQFICFLPFGSLMNHSCEPNIITFEFDRSMVFYVARPIKKEEQLFMSYLGRPLNSNDREGRREKLSKEFHFDCQCSACALNDLSWFDENYSFIFKPKMKILIEKIEKMIQELNENNEELKNDTEKNCTKNFFLIYRNMKFLQLISSYNILPFNV